MATATDEVNEFLNEGGAQSAKFDTVGKVVRGVIEDQRISNQTDINTGEVKTWQDGSARKQLVLTLLTEERDPAIDDDDGRRRLYAKYNMLAAIREAVKKSGHPLEVGGKLAVKYTGDGEAKQRGFNPPKLYSAQYEPPSITADELL